MARGTEATEGAVEEGDHALHGAGVARQPGPQKVFVAAADAIFVGAHQGFPSA
jgi:hypothetical protein